MTKNELQQQLLAAREENEMLRAQLAHTFEEQRTEIEQLNKRHQAELRVLSGKLFNAHSERSKWEARARANQPLTGSFAERAARARQLAAETGRSVAVGGV